MREVTIANATVTIHYPASLQSSAIPVDRPSSPPLLPPRSCSFISVACRPMEDADKLRGWKLRPMGLSTVHPTPARPDDNSPLLEGAW
jgi:hypothetical protein